MSTVSGHGYPRFIVAEKVFVYISKVGRLFSGPCHSTILGNIYQGSTAGECNHILTVLYIIASSF